MSKNGEKWMVVGGLAVAAVVVVALEILRHKRVDPLTQANRLLARCDDKISEIEESVAGLQSIVQAAA